MKQFLSGKFKCVVIGINGATVSETNWIDNLITNDGLNALGGEQCDLMQNLSLGTGTGDPSFADSQLFGYLRTSDRNYKVGQYYEMPQTYTEGVEATATIKMYYVFPFSTAHNITELGLVYGSLLTTHAMIRDANGEKTAISIKAGETLTVYYDITAHWSAVDAVKTIDVTEADGSVSPYHVTTRLAYAGNNMQGGLPTATVNLTRIDDNLQAHTSSTLGAPTSFPLGNVGIVNFNSVAPYVADSFQLTASCVFGLDSGNSIGKTYTLKTGFGVWQLLYERVSDGAGLQKDNNRELTMTFKFSWGRYVAP